ncbi:MAG TPA: VOC family protein [Labilithrix sp.]|nr:VOC family protein [Labilithrix sp.]
MNCWDATERRGTAELAAAVRISVAVQADPTASYVLCIMAIKLNHTIVNSRDARAGADFLVGLFGLPEPVPFGPFLGVKVANDVTLDYLDAGEHEIQIQHYAFLVSDEEFDQIFGRIRERGLTHWADPAMKQQGQINHHFGGRGVYFQDPSGHLLEIITRPYGNELPKQ